MSPQEIRDAITASPELLALARTPNPTEALAAALSAGRVRYVPYEAGDGAFLEAMPLAVANALLDVLKSAADYRHAKTLLARGALRLDKPSVRAGLQGLVGMTLAAGITLTQAHLDALFALAQAPDPVDEMDVRRAIYADLGGLLV